MTVPDDSDPTKAYITDAHGRIMRDRYGRPIARRTSQPSADHTHDARTRSLAGEQGSRYASPQQHDGASGSPAAPHAPQPYYAPLNSCAAQNAPGASIRREVRVDPHIGVSPEPDARVPAKRRRKRRRRRGCGCSLGCGGFLGLILVLALVLCCVSTLWLDKQLYRINAIPSTHSAAQGSGTNWLLVGTDSREGLTEEQQLALNTGGDLGSSRTDTIMVLHVPSLTGKPTLVSFPRDSYVNIPGYGMDKINAAYAYGGSQLLIATLEQATGLRIDHYAEVGFDGIVSAVDDLGGVNVCIDEPIADDVINFYLPAGCNDLSASEALSFVRTRATAMGDIDRGARQRLFLSALKDKVLSFRGIFKAKSLLGIFRVGTDDHIWDLGRIALSMIFSGGLETTSVPISGTDMVDVGSVVLWDDAAASALFAQLS